MSRVTLSKSSSVKHYKFLEFNYALIGGSRSAEGTRFDIEGLGITLDAGRSATTHTSKVFMTHGHRDHSSGLVSVLGQDVSARGGAGESIQKVDLYVPNEIFMYVQQMILWFFAASTFNMNPKIQRGMHFTHQGGMQFGKGTFYNMTGVIPGSSFKLPIKGRLEWMVEIVQCFHTVPCVGYLFSEMRNRLKPEYEKFREKKEELAKLKMEGVELSSMVPIQQLAFLGDTTTRVFTNQRIFDFPIIMIECSFLYPEHKDESIRDMHVHWDDLRPIVDDHPNNTFALMHFSQRYNDDEIRKFFKNKPCNVMLLI